MPNTDVIYFSPTGSTKQIGLTVADSIGCAVNAIDLTLPQNREKTHDITGSLVIVALPVYEEWLPKLLMSYLNDLKGNGQPAIAIIVLGNIHRGRALHQLCTLLQNRGFNVIAAGSFIARHSFSSAMRPVAAGRPDSADLEDAVSFGRSICQKIADGNPSPITVPRGKLSLMARILPADSAKMMIKPPRINSSNCLKCGACAHVCPVYAIDPVSFRVNHKTCIRCAACVKSCHLDARSMQFRIPIFDYVFMQMGKKRKRNIQIV